MYKLKINIIVFLPVVAFAHYPGVPCDYVDCRPQ